MYNFNIFSFSKSNISTKYSMYTFIKDLPTKSSTMIFPSSVMIIFSSTGSKRDLLLKLNVVLVQESMISFSIVRMNNFVFAYAFFFVFFLSGFSFTNIHNSRDSRGRGRVSISLLSTTSTRFTGT